MKRSGFIQRKTSLKSGGRINRISQKRQRQRDEYGPKRDAFLLDNPFCQVRKCNQPSNDVHHKRKGNGIRLTDQRYWMAVCRICHGYIETHRTWAMEQGYLIPVNGLEGRL